MDETEVEKEDNVERETEEHMKHSIVHHKINKNRRHRYAKYGATLYRVRWYNCEPDVNT